MTEEALIDFLQYSERLEALPRTGWLFAGIKDCESVASHSYQVALTAMWLADQSSLDVDVAMVLRMALLHDIGEAVLTDLPPLAKSLIGDVSDAEGKAVAHVLREAPAAWSKVWHRYETRQCLESKIVKAADVIQLLSKALIYDEQRRGNLESFFENVPRTQIPFADRVIEELHARFRERHRRGL